MCYIKPNNYYKFDFNKNHSGYDLAINGEFIRFPEKVNIIYASKGYGKTYYEIKRTLREKDKEIERLNSIIKEIREYIEKELGNVNTNENIIAKGICLKIKEIVGSDKE